MLQPWEQSDGYMGGENLAESRSYLSDTALDFTPDRSPGLNPSPTSTLEGGRRARCEDVLAGGHKPARQHILDACVE
jgi:hypothetical protein